MFDKTLFTSLRKQFNDFDASREKLIIMSRDVLKKSKNSIHSCHRGDMITAKKLLTVASTGVKKLNSLAKTPQLAAIGAVHDAFEEYVEACCFFAYCSGKKLPSPKSLNVGMHAYLPGICDLVGELFRKAMNDAIKGKYDAVFKIKDFVTDLYAELMQFDWRSSARRKFDSIKYHLEKLEDLCVQIKLKDKG
jgi:predicted translin family RNA/ssDNA-binding protein